MNHSISRSSLALCVLFSVSLVMLNGASAFAQETETPARQEQAQSPATPNPASLHPAFRHSPEEVKKAVERGQQLAHKSAPDWDIYRKFVRSPHWARKRGDTSGEYVACFGMEASHLTQQAYDAARKYEDAHIPSTWLTQGTYTSDLVFQVNLVSKPEFAPTTKAALFNLGEVILNIGHPKDAGRNSSLHHNDMELIRAASESSVQAEKFVISDDQGHNYTAEITKTDSNSGDVTLNTERTDIHVAAVLPNATVYEKTAVPYSEKHPYYEAKYMVRFPLFNADGTAKIGPSVKELTFRIITGNGEGNVTYKLPVPKRP